VHIDDGLRHHKVRMSNGQLCLGSVRERHKQEGGEEKTARDLAQSSTASAGKQRALRTKAAIREGCHVLPRDEIIRSKISALNPTAAAAGLIGGLAECALPRSKRQLRGGAIDPALLG
jgi:hypothetical protein